MTTPHAAAAALTQVASHVAHRDDIVVCCVDDPTAPPGQYEFTKARININVASFPHLDTRDEVLLGVLVHELGHAEHTPRRGVPAALTGWVDCVEEPRIEAAMLTSHPSAATWLRASAKLAAPTRHPRTPAEAAEALILTYGRVAAGVVAAHSFAAPAIEACAEIFAAADLRALKAIVSDAVTLRDDDLAGIVAAAAEIADIVDRAAGPPGQTPPGGHGHSHSTPQPPDSEDDPTDGRPAEHTDPHTSPPVDTTRSHANTETPHSMRVTPIGEISSTHRPPTADEVVRVQQVGSWLIGPTTQRSVVSEVELAAPPGKLDMAKLLRAHAQLDLGLRVTAKPWTRSLMRDVDTTPIELGLILDRSDSMRRHLDAVAGDAWVMAQSLTASGRGRCAVWGFSDFAEIIPTRDRSVVVVPSAGAGSSALRYAIADYTRWSDHGSGARVLAIISDGALQNGSVAEDISPLLAAGVRVLWFTPTRSSAVRLHRDLAPIPLDETDLVQVLLSATGAVG